MQIGGSAGIRVVSGLQQQSLRRLRCRAWLPLSAAQEVLVAAVAAVAATGQAVVAVGPDAHNGAEKKS